MRKVVSKKITVNYLYLTCTKCKYKERFVIGFKRYKKSDIPTAGWNGWDLRDNNELCPLCAMYSSS